jgi:hypothetical protein
MEVEQANRAAKVVVMKMSLVLWMGLLAGACVCAQEKKVSAVTKAPEMAGSTTRTQAEPFLLLPEPREMRVAHSIILGGAKHTVFTPMHRTAGKTALEAYSKAEFAKLGISADSFAERARAAADRILASLQPELIKDDAGRVRYAVYRGDEPIYACLMVAPSLGKVFQNVFGKEVWVAAPDRNALYVFPPNAAVVDDFSGDLEQRFEAEAFAASEEVFVVPADRGELKAVATFRNR